jgi:hypothetical protein
MGIEPESTTIREKEEIKMGESYPRPPQSNDSSPIAPFVLSSHDQELEILKDSISTPQGTVPVENTPTHSEWT